ncbi:hypothetical protein DICA1_E19878 [Diutina catenulata]
MSLALKFSTLLVRTLAKPISVTIKAQAKQHESFRKGCIAIAQFVHHTDAQMRMRLLGEKKFKVRPLNDNKAIETGATFLSESFIFSVAFGLIVYESVRSRKKAATQREALADDIEVLQGEMDHIKNRLKELNIIVDDYKIPEGYRPKYVKVNGEDDATHNSTTSKPSDSSETKSESAKTTEQVTTTTTDTQTDSTSATVAAKAPAAPSSTASNDS